MKRLFAAMVLVGLLAGAWWYYVHRREHSQDRVIAEACKRYGVDPALVKAVVWRESWFDPAAVGRVGEAGLMQIGDSASAEWAATEKLAYLPREALFNARTNVLAGTWYLGRLLKRYQTADRPEVYALADYNAGRTRVLRWMAVGGNTNSQRFLEAMDFPTTKQYVLSIMERRARYEADPGLTLSGPR